MVCTNSYVIFRNSAKSNIPGSDSLSQVAVICPHTSRAKRSWVQHQSCFSCAKSRNSTKLQVANLDQLFGSKNLSKTLNSQLLLGPVPLPMVNVALAVPKQLSRNTAMHAAMQVVQNFDVCLFYHFFNQELFDAWSFLQTCPICEAIKQSNPLPSGMHGFWQKASQEGHDTYQELHKWTKQLHILQSSFFCLGRVLSLQPSGVLQCFHPTPFPLLSLQSVLHQYSIAPQQSLSSKYDKSEVLMAKERRRFV